MPSVSNVAIGSNMAAAAATKARHGMNESIARLSTGIRAMYGADAAGHSVGTIHDAQAKSYASSTRNIENGLARPWNRIARR
jgi:flagellin-like hook-associated protein FlgL